MNNYGLLIIVTIFAMIHLYIFVSFFLYKQRLKKIAIFVTKMVFELVFELGKTLLMAGIVGIYFIPDTQNFTKAIVGGIIFFIVGYIAKKEQKD